MANNVYVSRSFSGNYPVMLSRQIMFQLQKTMYWGKWAKFNTDGMKPIGKNRDPQTVTSPVIFHYELSKEPGDWLKVPILRNLKNLPRTANQQLAGHEEEMPVDYKKVAVELFRHAVKPQESTIQTQVIKELRLLKNARPALQRHYSRVMNYLVCSFAMYYGYDWHVLSSTRWSGDSNITTTHHPHVFIAGQGKVSYSTYGYPGNSAYNQGIATEIGKITAGDVFDTGFLSGLKADPAVMKIEPIIMNNGNELRLIIAHPWQIADLEADSVFRQVQSAAMAQAYAKDNPYLVGCKYIYSGFAIFESDTMIWPVRVASSLPQYGPSTVQVATATGNLDSYESYSDDTMFAAIILGQNALSVAFASRMNFAQEIRDYEEIIGIAYKQIGGAARSDFWNLDDGTTGQYMLNESSALAITYAKAPTY